MEWAVSLRGDRANLDGYGDASGRNARGISAGWRVNYTASDKLCNSNTESTPFLVLSQRSAWVTGRRGLVSRYELCDLGKVSESDFPHL